ncbi:hypothetical protein QUF58_12315 [Anaerolineales bacterium HSG24]|nr:hypothetical protein [Anaerolineales bacterium HSG24]
MSVVAVVGDKWHYLGLGTQLHNMPDSPLVPKLGLGTQLHNMPETEFLWQIRSQSGDWERGGESFSGRIDLFLAQKSSCE